MKAAFLTGIRQFEIRQTPTPRIAEVSDVLIRIASVGVCGSDIHYYTQGRIGSQAVKFPFVIGHEAAGTVMETGREVRSVRAGERVAIDPAVSCGRCDQCASGREHTCRTLRFMGAPGQLDGALAEYVVLPERSCYPVPGNVTMDQATLAEPLAIAVYAVERAAVTGGVTAAVLGMGPIGVSVLHVLGTTAVSRVYATERIDERLSFARRLNPAWCGNPDRDNIAGEIAAREPLLLDRVFECSGDVRAIAQGIELLKPGGSLVIVGIPETDQVAFPIHELRRKEITIINVRRQVHATRRAIELIASRKIDIGPMATHHFGLAETQAAFDLVEGYRDGVMKAIITLT